MAFIHTCFYRTTLSLFLREVTQIGISFTMTERAWKVLQRKVEENKAIHKPGIFISSHSVKIGCREVGGNWISIQVRDSKEMNEEFEPIGICNKYPIFSDKESLL